MATMISEVYKAFIKAGCPEDAAREAAEAISSEQLATKGDIARIETKFDKELAVLKSDLAIIKWMLGLVIVRSSNSYFKEIF